MIESSQAVFLSYASQDADAARRICEALRAAGIEVWFDQSELRSGDAWDHHIRMQIRNCALFIPIISKNTQARPEGYFRLEWDLADQRTHMVSRNKAFIVPVYVDRTPDREADVPESFLKVQWTRLPGGETPEAFCERVRILLAGGSTANSQPAAGSVPLASAKRASQRWPLVTAVAVLVMLVGGWQLLRLAQRQVSSGSPPTAVPGVAEKSIAVLPFVDMSEKKDQEYFSDGVTEEILNLLADVPGIRVTSRTSSFSFRGQQLDLRTIAHRLGVNYVVEGSVQSAGDRVRITAQLIDVATDAHLWSQSYERKLNDVFFIQSDAAGKIARSLKIAMGADEAATLGRRPTQNIEAWKLFLKARDEMRNRTSVADVSEALSNVDAALERDPVFARAHSLRALILMEWPNWSDGTASFDTRHAVDQPRDSLKSREAQWAASLRSADRALELSPGLGEPYLVRALEAQFYNRYDSAEHNFREALLRAPGNPDAHNAYSLFLLASGYRAKGFAEAERAAALDPLSPLIAWQAAYAGLISGRFNVIESYSAHARENGWGDWQAMIMPGGVALIHGDFDRAEKIMVEALPDRAVQVRMALAAIRRRQIDAPTRAMLSELEPYGPPGIGRFATQILAGDVDAALATVYGTVAADSLHAQDASEASVRPAPGNASGSVLRADWWFPPAAAMRRDPRFAQFVRDIGLVKFWRANGWPDLCGPVGEGVVCK